MPEIKHVTVTPSGPFYFNHWGPHFEGPGGGVVAKPVGRSGGDGHAYITRAAATMRAEDLVKIARDHEAVFVVTVDHRDSDLDNCAYYVCGPLPADTFDA